MRVSNQRPRRQPRVQAQWGRFTLGAQSNYSAGRDDLGVSFFALPKNLLDFCPINVLPSLLRSRREKPLAACTYERERERESWFGIQANAVSFVDFVPHRKSQQRHRRRPEHCPTATAETSSRKWRRKVRGAPFPPWQPSSRSLPVQPKEGRKEGLLSCLRRPAF